MIYKIGYAVLTLLQLAFLTGIYIIHYFTKRKMGMLRYVIYQNGKWEKAYPLTTIIYGFVLLFLLLLTLCILYYRKHKNLCTKFTLADIVGTCLAVTVFTLFGLLLSTEHFRAYYYIIFGLGAVCFLQLVKTFSAVSLCKKAKI